MNSNLLSYLPYVATSAPALVGYVVVVASWTVRAWLVSRPQRDARQILDQYRTDRDRLAALTVLMGKQPPAGLLRKDLLVWVRMESAERSRYMLLVAYISTLLTAVMIVAIAWLHVSDKAPVIVGQETTYESPK